MKNCVETNRNYMVVKDNLLITRSRYSLTLQQHKILLYFISKVKPNDSESTMYEISLRDFMKLCGLNNSGFYYTAIKKDIKYLSDVSCWIEVEPGKEVLFRWLNQVIIDRNESKIRYSFHPSVAPYIFDLRKNYTRYKLKHILSLKHSYSIRIYEMLKAKMYTSDEFEVDIEEMKKRIDAEKYERVNSFSERVLIPAIDEINELTDLTVTYNFNKQGRRITSITFVVKQKNREMQILANIRQAECISVENRRQKRLEKQPQESCAPECEQLSFEFPNTEV